ncbi:MAG: enoyl-CoA hydratase/isomerase family protein [Saprospiraceae bacterium]|nr:enoyl-CoA hydratase/isomerase family protein [Saprospiraceae bacterium]
MQEYVNVITNDGLTTIEFFHPAQNSMPGVQLARLRQAVLEAGKDEKTSLILLKSGGDRSFCAGASFTELAAIRDLESSRQFFMGFAGVINAMRTCGKLVIGRIHGKAVGGGVGLASACDYTFATQHASVRLSELAVGIGPFVIGPAVERKVGNAAYCQMALTPEVWQSAEWALQKGLYQEVHATAAAMDEAIEALCQKLLSYHPAALHELKSVFWQGTQNWDQLLEERATNSGRLLLSDFSRKAIEGFLSKS